MLFLSCQILFLLLRYLKGSLIMDRNIRFLVTFWLYAIFFINMYSNVTFEILSLRQAPRLWDIL